ncbi:beta-lactamase family protein [Rhodocaloribacter litoris]|uniref:serine hydrolase domain-containing protein n=1 Tax=Rhodocaloribacter litoris TaxID=2558931 RepID=UPI00141FBDB0|nr:serine hydrolase domain-containing protein [Rhodocaloribacter litoris]QXD15264.1 beta-lactamase family protein [Rhodocaloribacter litoris]
MGGAVRAQPVDPVTAARIDSIFAAWDRPDAPGAAVAVLRRGEVVFEKGYGMANLEHDVPITPETVFMVASVSKQFTAFAVAMLAGEGRLSLDADIRTYLPEMHDFGTPITVRHLVHHTSGLRDEFDLLGMAGWRMDDVITKAHIVRLAAGQRELNFTPGDEYLYSNTGYTLLAEIVERVTGQSFREWTKEHLFDPLGMTQTHFHDDHEMLVPGRAQGYSRGEDGSYRVQVNNYASVGASSLHTTVRDLAKWLRNLDTGRVGGADVLAQVHRRGRLNNGDTLGYAFGLRVDEYLGHRRVGHAGWHRGYRTYTARFPEDDLAVIVLSNLEQFNPSERAMEVARLFLTPPPESLAVYTGTYVSPELDTAYTLVLEGDRLVARHRRNPDITLTFAGPDTFTTDAWFFEKLVFERSAGRITGFRASTTRVRNLFFERR